LGKIRINKLALELNIQNDQILDALQEKGHVVKNYMSSIDAETADEIRELFDPEPSSKKAAPKAKVSTKKTAAKKAAPKDQVSTKKTAAKKAAPKAKPTKTEKETAKKVTATQETTIKKVKVAKTTKKPSVEEKTEKKPVKLAKKPGLKIVKHEEKPRQVEKKPAPTKEKATAKPSKQAKVEKILPAKIPEPEQPIAEVEEEGFELVQISVNIMVRDLAEKLSCSPNDVIKELMTLGVMTTINQSLSFEVASKVADQRGFEVEMIKDKSALDFEEEEEENPEDLTHRPPIVTIMGHVDHGKTSLLDAIRKTNLTESEAGGITQHIGAYRATINGQSITFLDTPGHEAFTAMRARGAQVTDIVILVVAADDGIKPQTKEAIDHAHAGNVPILVAINKIDKPGAKPEEVKKQLAETGLLPEEWGGQTIFTEVSALQKTGIDHLLELILLQAEVLELKANPTLLGFSSFIVYQRSYFSKKGSNYKRLSHTQCSFLHNHGGNRTSSSIQFRFNNHALWTESRIRF